MLITCVQAFITELSAISGQLGTKDKFLLDAVKAKFLSLRKGPSLPESVSEELSQADMEWIQAFFAKRWEGAIGTAYDYTLNIAEETLSTQVDSLNILPQTLLPIVSGYLNDANKIWINLALEFATATKKNYLLVLMPTISNEKDPDTGNTLDAFMADPRSIFLTKSVDGLIYWHEVLGLLNRIDSGKPGETFSVTQSKDLGHHSLPLTVLLQFKNKLCPPGFKKNKYKTVWDYIQNEQLPYWQHYGEHPMPVIPTLVKMLGVSARYIKNISFEEVFREFADEVLELPDQDANHLYGTVIQLRDGGSPFLVELLLEYMQTKKVSFNAMNGINKWVDCINPALGLCIRPVPAPQEVLEWTTKLPFTGCEKLKPEMVKLQGILASATKLTLDIITLIKQMYAKRWLMVRGTHYDYTRHEALSDNSNWVSLLRCLVASNSLQKNYYQILIPTLKTEVEPVSLRPITDFPLTHCLLSSEDESQLIYLLNCKRHHEEHNTFYNCNAKPQPLTEMELYQLRYAAPRYIQYYLAHVIKEKDPTIRKSTVDAIIRMVNATLNPEALIDGVDITNDQQDIAEKAYADFLKFIESLPEDERQRLYKQRILFNFWEYSVKVILHKVLRPTGDGELGCIATYGQFFVQLVLDYDPNTRFCNALENSDKLDLLQMRSNSAQKLYRDFEFLEHLDSAEAERRLMNIYVSLLTYPFGTWSFMSCPINALGYTNTVCTDIRLLFENLNAWTRDGNLMHPRLKYAQTMQKIKNIHELNDVITYLTRPTETTTWLLNIIDESLFQKDKTRCFQPRGLMIVLASLLSKNEINPAWLIINVLERLLTLISGKQNIYVLWTSINIELQRLLQNENFPEAQQRKLLARLHVLPEISNQTFLEAMQPFIISRLVSCGIRHMADKGSSSQSLFRFGPGSAGKVQEELSTLLQDGLPRDSLHAILRGLQSNIEKLSGRFASAKKQMQISLQTLFPSLVVINPKSPQKAPLSSGSISEVTPTPLILT